MAHVSVDTTKEVANVGSLFGRQKELWEYLSEKRGRAATLVFTGVNAREMARKFKWQTCSSVWSLLNNLEKRGLFKRKAKVRGQGSLLVFAPYSASSKASVSASSVAAGSANDVDLGRMAQKLKEAEMKDEKVLSDLAAQIADAKKSISGLEKLASEVGARRQKRQKFVMRLAMLASKKADIFE